MKISSPCVGICTTDPSGTHCIACLRTMEEIYNWLGYSEEQRKHKMLEIEESRRAVQKPETQK